MIEESKAEGNEDCLYLNVYTPQVAKYKKHLATSYSLFLILEYKYKIDFGIQNYFIIISSTN